jgi:demethylmenaquinone methyltransferase / 2-methoxy-6-polyprenyl-1,4-benzoquinol methylase
VSEHRRTADKDHAQRVREMFATIAKRYDLLNHLLSANIDMRWRRLVARRVRERLVSDRSRILDVACGTGDLSLTLFEATEAQIIATDFCRPMLEIAASKSQHRTNQISLVEGDALTLPFMDQSFDAVTIGFGLRNLSAVDEGLKELWRVLKPGGCLAVLEFSKPQAPILRPLFQLYFTKLLPLLGGVISGSHGAYSYLPNSVQKFPDQKQLASIMSNLGFAGVSFENLTGGIAALHLAQKPK